MGEMKSWSSVLAAWRLPSIKSLQEHWQLFHLCVWITCCTQALEVGSNQLLATLCNTRHHGEFILTHKQQPNLLLWNYRKLIKKHLNHKNSMLCVQNFLSNFHMISFIPEDFFHLQKTRPTRLLASLWAELLALLVFMLSEAVEEIQSCWGFSVYGCLQLVLADTLKQPRKHKRTHI